MVCMPGMLHPALLDYRVWIKLLNFEMKSSLTLT